MRCEKHFLNYCALCNGDVERRLSKQKEYYTIREKRRERRAKHLQLQEASKFFATRHNHLYSEDELKYIILSTQNTTRNDIELFYNIAKKVKRRLGSIEWLWNYIWRDNFDEVLKDGFDNRLYEKIQNLKGELGV